MTTTFSRLPSNCLELIFEKCDPNEFFFVLPKVCRRFKNYIGENLRTFDSRNLLSLPNGGDFEEIVQIFGQNRFSRLSTLILFMTPRLPHQALSSVLQYSVPHLAHRLTKFVTNYPWVSEVAQMSSLQSLTIDLSDVGASHRLQSYGGYSIGSYPSLREARRPRSTPDKFASRHMGSDPWIFPSSGSLIELTIISDYITLPDEIRINLKSHNRLASLKYLKLRVPFSRIVYAEFDGICPLLETLDLDLESDCDRIKVPPTINKLVFSLRRASQPSFPFSSNDLPNLTDLTIRHAEPHFPRHWWNTDRTTPNSDLVFEPLLSMSRLNRLTILSSEFINRTPAYINLFEQMTATYDKPILEFLDLYLGRFPPAFINMLKTYFPSAEIRYNLGNEYATSKFSYAPNEKQENENESRVDFAGYPSDCASHIQCKFCCVNVREGFLEDHWEVCSESLKKCPLNCPFVGNRRQMGLHLLECPFYDVKCFECERTMTRAQWTSHIQHHEHLSTKLPPKLLHCPLRQTPEWLETKCHACRKTFPSLRDTQSHKCAQVGRRVLLPHPRLRIDRASMAQRSSPQLIPRR